MRHAAFLRAINVGGRRVKMDDLAQIFTDLGFDDVATYLASGNVTFAADDPAESAIEEALENVLGYEVPTFCRSAEELAEATAHDPFEGVAVPGKEKRYVCFLRKPLDEEQLEQLRGLCSEIDRFEAHGRHIYWLRDLDAGESRTTGELEKELGVVSTRRTLTTLQRILKKL